MQPLVSFAVIAYNESAVIEQCLASLLAQDSDGAREIIVVDDGSTDDTVERVQRLQRSHPEIRLLALDRNYGRGHARKAAIDVARGSYVATVDGDIILPHHWLAACLEAIEHADAVGGTATPDGDVAFLARRFGLEPKPVAHTITVSGSNGLYRRDVFETVSYDAARREGEDVDISHAMRRHEFRMESVPGLFVRHDERKDFGEAISWLFQSGRGAARQLYRHREIRLPDVVFAGWLASWSLPLLNRRSPTAWVAPELYAGAAAAGHVLRAFRWKRGQARGLGAAIALDAVMLTAYFLGRSVGLVRPGLAEGRRA